MVVAQKKKSLFAFWKKVRFEGGEGENDLWVHALFEITLVFLSFFSYLFFFLLALFSPFYLRKYTLFFDPLYRAQQEPFYNACRNHGFTVLPFNRLCLVWTYLPTTRGVCHSPLPDRGRFQFSPCRSASFLPRYKCSLSTLRACTQRFHLKLPLLGGLSSQQDVPPKRGLGKSCK